MVKEKVEMVQKKIKEAAVILKDWKKPIGKSLNNDLALSSVLPSILMVLISYTYGNLVLPKNDAKMAGEKIFNECIQKMVGISRSLMMTIRRKQPRFIGLEKLVLEGKINGKRDNMAEGDATSWRDWRPLLDTVQWGFVAGR